MSARREIEEVHVQRFEAVRPAVLAPCDPLDVALAIPERIDGSVFVLLDLDPTPDSCV